jgi:hypothetical protein
LSGIVSGGAIALARRLDICFEMAAE